MSQLKQRLSKLGSGSGLDSDSDNNHPSTTINPNNLTPLPPPPPPLPNNLTPRPPPPPPPLPSPQQSKGQRVISQTLASTAYLANLLPTGTLLAFQILTPVFTNNGQCDTVTRSLTAILLAMLAISCFLASFTDSLQGPDGQVYYGFATTKGMWLFDYPNSNSNSNPNLTKYKLRFIDWVHAVLSMFVFGVVALRDKNVVTCFAPTPSHEIQEVLDIVPIGVGLICSLLFVVFPTRRHGIGYPISPTRDTDK